jgi:hypothetical protein
LAITTLSRFASILQFLLQIGLWCVPLGFKSTGPGKVEKFFYVKWKPFQDRPPTSAEQIPWCNKLPRANGGIPTGPGTGIFVIDADNGEAIEWLELRGMTDSWFIRTRRGLHYVYRYPADIEVHNSASAIGAGIDVRGIGGMIVAPGSHYQYVDNSNGVLTLRSFTYEFEPGHAPADLPLGDPPSWLMRWLRGEAERRIATPPAPPQPYRGRIRAWSRKAFDANLDLLRCAEPGTRNTTAWNVARRLGQLSAGGELNSATVFDALYAIANSWPNSSHTIDTMQRAFKAGEANPRSAPPLRSRSSSFVTIDLDAPLGSETLNLDDVESLGHADPSADI